MLVKVLITLLISYLLSPIYLLAWSRWKDNNTSYRWNKMCKCTRAGEQYFKKI